MAVCWRLPLSNFDAESVWSPERYNPERAEQQALAENSVPLAKLVNYRKETFNPVGGGVVQTERFIVLDTNHAYEGRIQFRGQPVPLAGVGSIKRPLKPGNVIVSRLRTYLRQVALIDNDLIQDPKVEILCSTEFYVLEAVGEEDIAFLVPFLLSAPVQKVFSAAEEGGHHPRIPPDVLLKLAVPLSILGRRDDLSYRVRESVRLMRAGERVMAGVHADAAKLDAASPGSDESAATSQSPQRPRRARAAA